MTDLTAPRFKNETAARKHLESVRWPDGPVCPHCGCTGRAHKIKSRTARPGVYFCGDCRKQFTVTVGTLFERSKVPLHKWLLAVHLLSSSKKGMSAHQLHRTLGVTYKTAWFMAHRIREAMRPDPSTPMGGEGKTVEADETYISTKDNDWVFTNEKGWQRKRGPAHSRSIFALVERGGSVRSFHVEHVNIKNVRDVLVTNVDRKTALMTDQAAYYIKPGAEFRSHETVNHSADEYVRGLAHTNTIEGFFSIFKRGMKGVYQHCGEKHLHRYLAEFDFRYSNRIALGVDDAERAVIALRGIEGKRLTYRRANAG